MPRPLSDQVVVITGASSGIGRETAIQFGRAGASVVLAARSAEALEEVAREVEEAGGKALAVPTDVAEWPEVERLGERTLERFGRIDTWVNDAGVAEYANAWEHSPEEMERIIRVDLLGVMFGTRVALDRMSPHGEGVIVNVGSVISERAFPMLSGYAAAKHGVKGFTESLQLELKRDRPGIQAVLVMPSSINTPFFRHARTKMGSEPQPIPPIYQPEVVAEVIVHAAQHPIDRIVAGGGGKMLTVLERINPGLAGRFLRTGGFAWKGQQSDEPPGRRDNLFEPSGGGPARGEFGEHAMETSEYTRVMELYPSRKTALGLAAVAGTAFLLTRRR